MAIIYKGEQNKPVYWGSEPSQSVYEDSSRGYYGNVSTWEEYWELNLRLWRKYGGPYPDKKKEYRRWYKMYKMK